MKNKRGQDLSIGTLILIVLGVIVLVLLILGFSMGWSNLWDKINIFGGGGSINDVVLRCQNDVVSGNTYGYCQVFDKVKIDGNTEYVNCEDDRVLSGLDTTLTCTGLETDRIKAKCLALLKSEDVKESTRINTQMCWETYTCQELDGTTSAPPTVCPTDKTKEITEGVKELNAGSVCCVTP